MGGGGGGDAGFDIPVQEGEHGFKALIHNKKALGLATFASLGGVLYGYNQGVFGQVQVMYSFTSRYPTIYGTGVDPVLKGLVTSILELGAFLGAIVAGPIADRISRKYSISCWCLIFMLGTALQVGASTNIDFIWAGRFIAGLGVGALSFLVPLYNAELAPAGIRGSLVALQQLAITFGILISYWIGYGTNNIGGTGTGQSTAAWRVPLAIQLVPALVLFFGAYFLPFSPRWLMLRGREEEALLTLANLRDMAPESYLIQAEYMALQAERLVQEDEARERYGEGRSQFYIGTHEYWRIVSTPGLLKRLLLGVAAQSFQQWTGINAIIYYAPTIFEQIGLTGGSIPLLATGIVGVVNFVLTIPAVLFVDNLGRKPMLAAGALSMCICLAIVAAIIASFGDDFPNHKSAGNAAVFFVYWFITSFAVTWGPLAWVVAAEAFSLSTRAKGMSISSGTNWLMNFTVATVTPIMITNIGYKTYIVFLCFTFAAFLWSIFILPELKGKTLEQIDAAFSDNSGAVDAARRDKIARQIGLDKISPAQMTEHKEAV